MFPLRSVLSLRYIITVEPIFFCYIANFALQKPLLQEFLLDHFGRIHNYTSTNNELCGVPNHIRNASNSSSQRDLWNSHESELENIVQAETSHYVLYLTLASMAPSLFTSVVYGSWSDRAGRKPLFILSLTGALINAVIVACIANYDLPYYLLFVGAAVDGICGSFSSVMLSGFAYISDITDIKQRALRIGILEAVIFTGATVAFFIGGNWVAFSGGYQQPFWGSVGLMLFTVLYTIIILPESLPPAKDVEGQEKKKRALNCKEAFKNIYQLFNLHPVLYVGTMSFFFIMFGIMNDITIMYTKASPFCWSDTLVGYWQAAMTGTRAIGLIAGTKILSMFCSDSVMVIIGIFSNIGSYIVLGLAQTTLMLFLSIIPSVVQGTATASLRTIMSKLSPPDKQGVVFSAISLVQALVAVLAPLMYNTVYPISRSKLHFPGFCFFLTIIILLPAIPMMIYIYYKAKHIKGYKSINPQESKPENTTSNEVTDFSNNRVPINA